MIRFGGYAYLLSSTGVFRDVMVDNFVISRYLDTTQVAMYGFVYTILNIISNLNPVNLFKNLISHVLIRKYVNGGEEVLFCTVHRLTTTVSMCFLFPLLGFLLLFLGDIVKLINKNYINCVILTIIMSSLIVFNALTYSYAYILNTLEKMQYRFYANIFSIYNLIADIILVKFYGLYGIAIATCSASFFTVVYYHYVIKQILKINLGYHWPAVYKISFNVTVSLFASWLAAYLGGNILVSAMVFGMSYCGLSYMFNPLHTDDRQILKKLIFNYL